MTHATLPFGRVDRFSAVGALLGHATGPANVADIGRATHQMAHVP